jgi:hypothetical protein
VGVGEADDFGVFQTGDAASLDDFGFADGFHPENLVCQIKMKKTDRSQESGGGAGDLI